MVLGSIFWVERFIRYILSGISIKCLESFVAFGIWRKRAIGLLCVSEYRVGIYVVRGGGKEIG